MLSTIAQTMISLTQSIELSILAKATVMLTLGLAAARLAVQAPASVRHLLLTATFAALIALPLAAVTVPGVVIQVPVANAEGPIAASSAAPLFRTSSLASNGRCSGKRNAERRRHCDALAHGRPLGLAHGCRSSVPVTWRRIRPSSTTSA
jgi:hypothetical protein